MAPLFSFSAAVSWRRMSDTSTPLVVTAAPAARATSAPGSALVSAVYHVADPARKGLRIADTRRLYAARMMVAYAVSLTFAWFACLAAFMARDELSAGCMTITCMAFALTLSSWFCDTLLRGDLAVVHQGVTTPVYRDECYPVAVCLFFHLTEVLFHFISASIGLFHAVIPLFIFSLVVILSVIARVYFGTVSMAHDEKGRWYQSSLALCNRC